MVVVHVGAIFPLVMHFNLIFVHTFQVDKCFMSKHSRCFMLHENTNKIMNESSNCLSKV